MLSTLPIAELMIMRAAGFRYSQGCGSLFRLSRRYHGFFRAESFVKSLESRFPLRELLRLIPRIIKAHKMFNAVALRFCRRVIILCHGLVTTAQQEFSSGKLFFPL